MKREIKIYGYNEKHGEFVIHTSDQYDNNTTVKAGELTIHFNKIGQLKFTVYPTNKSFEKLLAIETDIVVCEIENGLTKQIFNGIVFNINAFSNKNLNIGKSVTCISSHIFFQYRPVCKLVKTKNNEYSYIIDTEKLNQGNSRNVIDLAITSCLHGCNEEQDINRYMYNFLKNQLDSREQKNYGATYTKNDNLSKMFSNIINFYDLELIFEYNFLTLNLKNRHTFYFVSKNQKKKKNILNLSMESYFLNMKTN